MELTGAQKLIAPILPDSRAQGRRGAKQICGVWHIPIFCANCHREGGMVPEENMTFAYWVCTPCYEKLGDVVNTYVMPDEVFWEKVKQEEHEKYGRDLTDQERLVVADSDTSPLATLYKQGR